MHQVINREKIAKGILGITFVMIVLLAVIRCIYVNLQYPNPTIQTITRGNILSIGNYEISLTDWKWGNGEIILSVYPGYHWLEIDGKEYPVEKERVGLAKLTIHKVKKDETSLDLSEISFSSGAWGNQFDLELFYKLNPDLNDLRLKLSENETVTIGSFIL